MHRMTVCACHAELKCFLLTYLLTVLLQILVSTSRRLKTILRQITVSCDIIIIRPQRLESVGGNNVALPFSVKHVTAKLYITKS